MEDDVHVSYGPAANSTPPKLSLSNPPPWIWKPPRGPTATSHMLTPPLHPSASVPFHWEEAPGKPRAAASPTEGGGANRAAGAARCLELPPRLMFHDDGKITTMPSPTAVLDGPYVGRSLSMACTFSFRKAHRDGEGSFDISRGEENYVKITRVRRRRSFFGLPFMNSNLQGIYSSLKRAVVPWKLRKGR